MKKLIMTKGLSWSGKSTRAKMMVENAPWQYKRVNNDDLRAMLDCGRWSKINEKIVIETRNNIIASGLNNGFNVIVDNTNLNPIHETELRELAKKHWAQFRVEHFDLWPKECIERDAKRENSVGAKVIRDMYNKYVNKHEGFQYYKYDKTLKDVIVCDIDWTLSEKWERDIYDSAKAYLDRIIPPVRLVVNSMKCDVIVMSGRSSDHREITEQWLKDNDVDYHTLIMRPSGDTRPDYIVKKELYEKHIKDKFNVLFSIDDRVSVVDWWRELGIFTFDVNQQRNIF